MEVTSERIFRFEQSDSDSPCEQVRISERLLPEYGYYVWPSAMELGRYLFQNRSDFHSKCIIEIGAGCGLPGILLAKCAQPRRMILTDDDRSESFLDLLKHNVACNIPGDVGRCDVVVKGLRWGEYPLDVEDLIRGGIDYIIAADCFYDPQDFEDVIATVSLIMDRNPTCQFITAYHERSSKRTIEPLLQQWGLTAELIPRSTYERVSVYSSHGADHSPRCLLPNDSVHVYMFKRKKMELV